MAASDVYSATDAAHSSSYSLKYHSVSVLHMYEGRMQSLLMEWFSKVTKKRIPDNLDRKKPLKYLVINYILNDIKHERVGSETDKERKRELLVTASYTYVAYIYSLRGHEG